MAREYESCPDDPRVVRQFGAREAIATSTGQNDSGLFELNFNDERYLPFEYMGAVSRWRIELPPENNFFDMNTLSDLMLRLNFIAREGGTGLRRAANAYAQRHLPGDGWCFFDVRHEFPDAWQLFLGKFKEDVGGKELSRHLKLRLDRKMFPFVPGSGELFITKIAVFFDVDRRAEDECRCPEIKGCPCPHRGEPARQIIEFSRRRERDEDYERKRECQHKERYHDEEQHGREEHHEVEEHREGQEHYKRNGPEANSEPRKSYKESYKDKKDYDSDDHCTLSVACVASDAWPDLYFGMFDAQVGSLSKGRYCTVDFGFPCDAGEVKRVLLLLRYTVEGGCHTSERRLQRQLCVSKS
jgi:hypothetical protein